jgi:long-subunit acyl-CoA synthetase (AMP-forming)
MSIPFNKFLTEQYIAEYENPQAVKYVQTLCDDLKIVFHKIYQRFGGKIRFFVSGGAPLSTEIIKFLRENQITDINESDCSNMINFYKGSNS